MAGRQPDYGDEKGSETLRGICYLQGRLQPHDATSVVTLESGVWGPRGAASGVCFETKANDTHDSGHQWGVDIYVRIGNSQITVDRAEWDRGTGISSSTRGICRLHDMKLGSYTDGY
ncbi:uncharacterized protein ACLA_069890 [Aspergillus clavatus NRRL 1]|uniref:Uncharacterized protein n=1 Tax=Aspergillus clavatus (strain ATCC 1007 / CBS 513.65 / DSM 816 / NCTC 3887 / NRRL 1 / QM 1276 / 107) TaxID=344612 RepID=A1C6D7_ASPCL|nr:uncharacterized protein ACLA_069890 [Aspergillus clavatus NRRL 1]EAW13958.1 hypothetical protein ACLA_069890 [Aspergillus clavatus NRRL 1]